MCEYNEFELELGSLNRNARNIYSKVKPRKYERASI